MAAPASTALALAFVLHASAPAAPSPIHLEVHATPGLSGPAPFWVELDATGTTTDDPQSDWVRDYHFATSDGAEGDLAVFDHTFVEPGRYTVTVSARDADGHVAKRTLQLLATTAGGADASSLRLRVDADPGYAGTAPFWVRLDASGSSSTDPNDWIYSYRWTASDGTSASTATFDHLFATPGQYTVRLAIEDLYGRAARWSRTIDVAPGAEEPEPARRAVVHPTGAAPDDHPAAR